MALDKTYPPLPEPDIVVTDTGDAWLYTTNKDVEGKHFFNAEQVYAAIDADRALRAAQVAPTVEGVMALLCELTENVIDFERDQTTVNAGAISATQHAIRAEVEKLATPPAGLNEALKVAVEARSLDGLADYLNHQATAHCHTLPRGEFFQDRNYQTLRGWATAITGLRPYLTPEKKD